MRQLINRFTRVTSTGSYLPEIDGLRFLAISWDFVYHLNDFLTQSYHDNETKIFQQILGNGHLGVELFFVISGFVLSLPFAKYYFKQGNKVYLKQYFLRRLTRLEPPYFLIMIFLFLFLSATRLHTVRDLTPHLFASLFYIHNLVYPGTLPVINSVAWSLEIEIQFYIMVPLLARIFILQKKNRRIVLSAIILVMPVMQFFFKSDTLFFYQFLQYFVVGFLLCDLYMNNDKQHFYRPSNNGQKKLFTLLGMLLFAGILIVHSRRNDLIYTIFIPLAILLFYCIVLFIPFWNKVFSAKWISIIGGMSYTIYLIHVPIIATFGRFFVNRGIMNNYLTYFIIQSFIWGPLILFAGSIFFYFIERPCMKKDWYVRFYKNKVNKKKI